MNGKGDTQRPVDKNKFDENFERIFGLKKPAHGKTSDKTSETNKQS